MIKQLLFIIIIVLCLPVYAAGAVSGIASRPYGNSEPLDAAVASATTDALLKAHFSLLRQLAQEPVIQQISTVTGTFSPPDINGLVYYLYTFSPTHVVDPTTKTITATTVTIPNYSELRQEVFNSLHRRNLFERYGAVLQQQKTALDTLNGLISTPADNGQREQAIHTAANALLALERYRILLSQYSLTGWETPSSLLEPLESLLTLAPGNPLIHGALGEVYYQLGKPQQALQHIDRALAKLPQHAYLHGIKGLILLQLDLPALAAQSLTAAIEIDGHNASFFQHRATSFLVQDDIRRMCQDFTKACVLGDCSGYEWAHEHNLCLTQTESAPEQAQNLADHPE